MGAWNPGMQLFNNRSHELRSIIITELHALRAKATIPDRHQFLMILEVIKARAEQGDHTSFHTLIEARKWCYEVEESLTVKGTWRPNAHTFFKPMTTAQIHEVKLECARKAAARWHTPDREPMTPAKAWDISFNDSMWPLTPPHHAAGMLVLAMAGCDEYAEKQMRTFFRGTHFQSRFDNSAWCRTFAGGAPPGALDYDLSGGERNGAARR